MSMHIEFHDEEGFLVELYSDIAPHVGEAVRVNERDMMVTERLWQVDEGENWSIIIHVTEK